MLNLSASPSRDAQGWWTRSSRPSRSSLDHPCSDLEHALGGLDRRDERVAFGDRVVQVEARAGRGGNAEPVHERLITVVARPHAQAFAVEDLRDIVWMNALDGERDHADPIVQRPWPEQRHAIDGLELRQDMRDERQL